MRAASEHSLRFLVEKWLAPGPSMPVRVTEFSRTRTSGRRYVRVETALAAGARSLFFFRHDDGCWCVFPPTADTHNMANETVGAQLAMAVCE
ncbi:hypothetical protein P3T43_001955 [Paraburkholderia sp. GAS41]|jgi:hypothetical protein|uniref:hypothetical protein n=1 Tax=Paraburkholderia sp. GAS41 TaxID=3035134 RepID=UPI003D1E9374